LREELGIPSNGVLLARRDKYEMAEMIRAQGIPAVVQMRSRSVEQVLDWVKASKLWPGVVVLKPPMSAGSEGVYFCRNEMELREKFSKILVEADAYGGTSHFVLAQEYLDGIEYVVNTVSAGGKHVVTDIWQYHKRNVEGAGTIYDYDRLLPFEGEIQKQLVEYDLRVLDALAIKTGWGHAEIKMTKRGPVLVEVGSRMMGSGQPRLVGEALGRGQIELGLDAYLNPKALDSVPLGYAVKKHAALVNISSFVESGRLSLKGVSELMALPGYVRHSFTYKEGDVVQKTVNMFTALGQVELVHEDPKVLETSIETIRRWSDDGKFIVR
jgi:biotin carboxylase